jgi:hypothetical protein
VKFAWIAQHRPEFPVGLMCAVLQVSRSGYYAWRVRPASPRQQRRGQLLTQIRQIQQGSAAFPHIRPRIMVSCLDEFFFLQPTRRQWPSRLSHRESPFSQG